MDGLLQGGRRRRRAGPWAFALVVALAPAAVAGAGWIALAGDDEPRRASAPPVAVGATPGAPGPAAASEPTPLVRAEPVPEVPLSGVDSFHLRFRKPPPAGLVFDVDSGEVLWRRRPQKPLPIASLTKIMTALLVTERAGPEERVSITAAALRFRGSGLGVLKRGRRVRLETLLNGLLLVSGNDAAIALSVHVAGAERRFVRLMNRRARELGLRCTRFWDSHGLSPHNSSCVRDLAVMTRLAMARRRITRIVRRAHVAFPFPIKGRRLFLSGHNPLIRAGYPGAIGLKTGYTRVAGRCFVGVARRRGRTLAVVLLNSANPAKHAPRLLDEGFASR
jgi:serine-type D-Ala-D-Ala carboxypeptidase (penicillin-binding protein 5/6)